MICGIKNLSISCSAFGLEVSYLSAIGALMYIVNNTRSDIAFLVNLLARYSFSPTKRHWNRIKDILFRYLQGTINMRLLYSNKSKFNLVGFANSEYLFDPHKTRSQTSCLFTFGGTSIFW